MQSNSLIKSSLIILMFNVLQKSLSVHALQSSAIVGRTDAMDYNAMYSSTAVKSGGVRAHLDPNYQKAGFRTSGSPQDRRHCSTYIDTESNGNYFSEFAQL